MRKALIIGFILVILIAGLIFVSASPKGGDESSSSGMKDTPHAIISETHRELVDGHLRTAVKKQSIDATDQREVEIAIGDFYYDPSVLKIKRGATVTWRNKGMISHDVKIDSSSPGQGPGSSMLGRQESYTYTFDEPGLYLYYCSPHPTQMRAVIEVVE